MLSLDAKKSIIILVILTAFSTVFVVLRLVLRLRKGLLGVDDKLLIFALFMVYLQDAGAFLLAIKGGEGKPIATLTPSQVEWLLKMFYWPELGYTILIATIKISILISYKRIFGNLQWFRMTVYTLMGLEMIWFIGVFFAVMFQCTPVDKAWIPEKPGHCLSFDSFLWGNSISNNILDYIILLLPVVPVWRLHTKTSQKLLILGSFALGSTACAASTTRAVLTGTVNDADLSESAFLAAIWTYIEPSMGIMGACLPFLANGFRQQLQEWAKAISTFGSTQKTRIWNFSSRFGHSKQDSVSLASGPDVERQTYELSDNTSKKGSQKVKQNRGSGSESTRNFVDY